MYSAIVITLLSKGIPPTEFFVGGSYSGEAGDFAGLIVCQN